MWSRYCNTVPIYSNSILLRRWPTGGEFAWQCRRVGRMNSFSNEEGITSSRTIPRSASFTPLIWRGHNYCAAIPTEESLWKSCFNVSYIMQNNFPVKETNINSFFCQQTLKDCIMTPPCHNKANISLGWVTREKIGVQQHRKNNNEAFFSVFQVGKLSKRIPPSKRHRYLCFRLLCFPNKCKADKNPGNSVNEATVLWGRETHKVYVSKPYLLSSARLQ